MESENRNRRGRKYTNGEITVYWKPDACVHASHCYRELLEVFDPGRRPWVDMYGASTAEIIRTVNMCPTEALTWKWNDEEKNRDIDPSNTNHVNFRRPDLLKNDSSANAEPVSVKIMPDGPVVINGSFVLKYGGKEKNVDESIISLCRCGSSNHLPFCDGTHRKTGFNDN
ncbi:MAG TPA: (4Fe-4S)-binding protein [Bacteroidales bacterium]|nr:(4Fe-4S)-binding protein [Bacteroidales bacterium]HRR94252.1 (4Fe-4S)-binding protein [Bacteroidales bacterium]HRT90027.1 (4Fe-4S)-binding protein [Bacteroidales bacterium]